MKILIGWLWLLPFLAEAQLLQYPADIGVLNVRDFGAKGDGIADDTQAIQAVLDHQRRGVPTRGIKDYFYGKPKTIYFPRGTYLVSDTLGWVGQTTMLIGQGPGYTTIRLKDRSARFQDKQNPMAVMKTQDGIHQFRNYLRDLSIDTGSDNPGATGIDFISNNSGGLINVEIRSGDGQGFAGIRMERYAPGPLLLKHVTVTGFDYGIRLNKSEYSVTMEYIHLSGQRIAGIYNHGNIVSMRKVYSNNAVPAVSNAHDNGMVVLLDSELKGGAEAAYAIENSKGTVYVRNVRSAGYRGVLKNGAECLDRALVKEYASGASSALFSHSRQRPASYLPVRETPEYTEEDESQWVRLTANHTGSTEGWHQQLHSGKRNAYFTPGTYLVKNQTFQAPESLRRIHGFGAGIHGERDQGMILEVKEGHAGSAPLIIEHMGFGLTIRHRCKRPVVIKHSKVKYESSEAAGDLYLEDVELHGAVVIEKGRKLFARQWNNEKDTVRLTNRGEAWILGLKTEQKNTVALTTDGGRTEIWGAFLYPVRPFTESDAPAFINRNGTVSLVFGASSYKEGHMYPVLIRETRRGEVRELSRRNLKGRFVPLYQSGH